MFGLFVAVEGRTERGVSATELVLENLQYSLYTICLLNTVLLETACRILQKSRCYIHSNGGTQTAIKYIPRVSTLRYTLALLP